MKKILSAAAALLLLTCSATAADEGGRFLVGGRWMTAGSGWCKYLGLGELLRVSFEDSGTLTFHTVMSGDTEVLKSVDIDVKLYVSKLKLTLLDDVISYDLPEPGLVLSRDWRPTVNEPLELPEMRREKLTAKLAIVSEKGGTLLISGTDPKEIYEVWSSNAMWREGSEPPEIPDGGSGCRTGALWAVCALAAYLRRHGW